jgi:hypothetical protein
VCRPSAEVSHLEISPSLPRIRKLSQLSISFIFIQFQEVSVKFLKEELHVASEDSDDLLMKVLSNFASKMRKFSDDPVNQYLLFSQASNQLRNMEIGDSVVARLLCKVTEDCENYSDHRKVQMLKPFIAELNISRTDTSFQAFIFCVKLTDVWLSVESMMYDSRVSLGICQFNVFNNTASSLLHAGDARKPDGSSFRLSSRRSLVEEETLVPDEKSSCVDEDDDRAELFSIPSSAEGDGEENHRILPLAFSLQLNSRSEKFPFGEGGFSSRVLYEEFVFHEKRNNEWIVELDLLSVEFDAVYVLMVLNELSKIKNKVIDFTAAVSEKVPARTTANGSLVQRHDSIFFRKAACSSAVQIHSHDISFNINRLDIILASTQDNFCFIRSERCQGLFSHSQQNDFRGNIGRLHLYDLTSIGKVYREVLWKGQREDRDFESPSVSFLAINEETENARVMTIVLRLRFLRVTFLYRFLIQMIVFISDQIVSPIQEFLGTDSTSDAAERPPSVQNIKPLELEVLLMIDDTSVYIPRNSCSFDIIGLSVDSAVVRICSVPSCFVAPASSDFRNDLSDSVLVFEHETNRWRRALPSMESLYPPHLSDLRRVVQASDADPFKKSESYDVLKNLLLQNRNYIRIGGEVFRIASLLRDINIFVTLATTNGLFDEISVNANSYRFNCLFELVSPSLTEIEVHHRVARKGIQHNQIWRLVTRHSANLDVIIDFFGSNMKLLFCDVPLSRTLDLALCQSELYLIISFWFDNFHEVASSEIDENNSMMNEMVGQLSHHTSASDISEFGGGASTRLGPEYREVLRNSYGSSAYFSYFLHRQFSFELLVVQSKLELSAAIDQGMFDREIPSVESLRQYESTKRSQLSVTHPFFVLSETHLDQNNNRTLYDFDVYPVARLIIQGAVVHITSDDDVTHIGVTASMVDVIDGCHPLENNVLLTFKSFPHTVRYGSVQFEELFNIQSCSDYRLSSDGLPLCLGILLSSKLNWMNINLFLDSADLFVSNLDICLILGEYFSCYFRFSEYGHPGLQAFYQLDGSVLPYGGLDFRLLLHKPHVSVWNPASSSIVFVEADNGVLYRYMYDSNNGVKTSYDLQSLALVYVPDCNESVSYRSARGSSGFGAAKTIIEFINVFVFQQFCGLENRQDLKIEITSSEDTSCTSLSGSCLSNKKEIHNFAIRDQVAGLEITMPETNYLNSLVTFSKKFPLESGDIVVSFEDLLSVVAILQAFWGGSRSDDISVISASESKPEVPSYLDGFTAFNCFGKVSGIKLLLIDNVLGMHLPFFQVFLQDIAFALDNQEIVKVKGKQPMLNRKSGRMPSTNRNSISVINRGFFAFSSPTQDNNANEQLLLSEMRCYSEVIFWVESFNNLKKCWEPMVEPCGIHFLYEKVIFNYCISSSTFSSTARRCVMEVELFFV